MQNSAIMNVFLFKTTNIIFFSNLVRVPTCFHRFFIMMILLLLKLRLLISVDVVVSGDIEAAMLYVHVVCGKIP